MAVGVCETFLFIIAAGTLAVNRLRRTPSTAVFWVGFSVLLLACVIALLRVYDNQRRCDDRL